jgi:hypothetical protein
MGAKQGGGGGGNVPCDRAPRHRPARRDSLGVSLGRPPAAPVVDGTSGGRRGRGNAVAAVVRQAVHAISGERLRAKLNHEWSPSARAQRCEARWPIRAGPPCPPTRAARCPDGWPPPRRIGRSASAPGAVDRCPRRAVGAGGRRRHRPRRLCPAQIVPSPRRAARAGWRRPRGQGRWSGQASACGAPCGWPGHRMSGGRGGVTSGVASSAAGAARSDRRRGRGTSRPAIAIGARPSAPFGLVQGTDRAP